MKRVIIGIILALSLSSCGSAVEKEINMAMEICAGNGGIAKIECGLLFDTARCKNNVTYILRTDGGNQ